MDPIQIWKQMTDELRAQAAEDFFNDAGLKEFHRAAETFIARQKNFRPAFIKRLPVAKRAFYLSHMPLSAELASQLLVSYHFAHQRPLMSTFLNALGIPNEDGLITENAEVTTPAQETIDKAVQALRAEFPEEDVQRYLATLAAQNPEVWGGLAPHLAATPEANS